MPRANADADAHPTLTLTMLDRLPDELIAFVGKKVLGDGTRLENRLSVISLSGTCRALRRVCHYEMGGWAADAMNRYLEKGQMVVEQESETGIVDGRNAYWKSILKVVVLAEPLQIKDPQDLPLPKWSPPPTRTGQDRAHCYDLLQNDGRDERFCDHINMDIQKQQRWQRDLQNQLIALGVQKLKSGSKQSKNQRLVVPTKWLFQLKVVVTVVVYIPRACRYTFRVPHPIHRLLDRRSGDFVVNNAHRLLVRVPRPTRHVLEMLKQEFEIQPFYTSQQQPPNFLHQIGIPGVHTPQKYCSIDGINPAGLRNENEWTTVMRSELNPAFEFMPHRPTGASFWVSTDDAGSPPDPWVAARVQRVYMVGHYRIGAQLSRRAKRRLHEILHCKKKRAQTTSFDDSDDSDKEDDGGYEDAKPKPPRRLLGSMWADEQRCIEDDLHGRDADACLGLDDDANW